MSGKLGIISQTTQPIDRVNGIVEQIRLRRPTSEVMFLDTVCSPTKNRQRAVRELCDICDFVVVVGGSNSNNTAELVSTVEKLGCRAVQVERAEDLGEEWFFDCFEVGVTAGTSTLDETVISVYERIRLIAEEFLQKTQITC